MSKRMTNGRMLLLPATAATIVVYFLAGGILKADRPELGFRKEPHPAHEHLTFVWATFPEVPGLTCDAWCYESNVEFLDFRKLDGGQAELRHRSRDLPELVFVTTVTPEPGAVEFVARAVVDRQEHPDEGQEQMPTSPVQTWSNGQP